MNQRYINDQIDVQKELHNQIKKLQAEVERLKSDESACVWAEDQEGNWDTKCGDKHYLTAGTPFENGMHWCCYCGGSLLEELYGEQAND